MDNVRDMNTESARRCNRKNSWKRNGRMIMYIKGEKFVWELENET
jgi:hypothetical protein